MTSRTRALMPDVYRGGARTRTPDARYSHVSSRVDSGRTASSNVPPQRWASATRSGSNGAQGDRTPRVRQAPPHVKYVPFVQELSDAEEQARLERLYGRPNPRYIRAASTQPLPTPTATSSRRAITPSRGVIKVTPQRHVSNPVFGSSAPRFPGGDTDWVRELPPRILADGDEESNNPDDGGVEKAVCDIERGEGSWGAVDPAVRDAVSMLLRTSPSGSKKDDSRVRSPATYRAAQLQGQVASDPFGHEYEHPQFATPSNHRTGLNESTGRELQYANAPFSAQDQQYRYRSPGGSLHQPVAGNHCHQPLQACSSYSPYGHRDPQDNAYIPWVPPAYRSSRENAALNPIPPKNKKGSAPNNVKFAIDAKKESKNLVEEQHPTNPDHAGSSYSPLLRDRTDRINTFGEATKHRRRAVKNIAHLYRNVGVMEAEMRLHIHPQVGAAIQLDPELMKLLRAATVSKGQQGGAQPAKSLIPEILSNKLETDEKNLNDFVKSLRRTAKLFTRFMDGFLSAEEEAAVAYQRIVSDTDTTDADESSSSSDADDGASDVSSVGSAEDNLPIPTDITVVKAANKAEQRSDVEPNKPLKSKTVEKAATQVLTPPAPPVVQPEASVREQQPRDTSVEGMATPSRSINVSGSAHQSSSEHPISNHEGRLEDITSPTPPHRQSIMALPHVDVPAHVPHPEEPQHITMADRHSLSANVSLGGSSISGASPSPSVPRTGRYGEGMDDARSPSSSPKLHPSTRTSSHSSPPLQQQRKRLILNVEAELVAEPKGSQPRPQQAPSTTAVGTTDVSFVAVSKGKGPTTNREIVGSPKTENKSVDTTNSEGASDSVDGAPTAEPPQPLARVDENTEKREDIDGDRALNEINNNVEEEPRQERKDDNHTVVEEQPPTSEIISNDAPRTTHCESPIDFTDSGASGSPIEAAKTATLKSPTLEEIAHDDDARAPATPASSSLNASVNGEPKRASTAVGPRKQPATPTAQSPTSVLPAKKKMVKRPLTKQGPSPQELALKKASKPSSLGASMNSRAAAEDYTSTSEKKLPSSTSKKRSVVDSTVVVQFDHPEEDKPPTKGESEATIVPPAKPEEISRSNSVVADGSRMATPINEVTTADGGVHPPPQDQDDNVQMAIRPRLQSSRQPAAAADPPPSLPAQAPTPRDENLGPSRTRNVSQSHASASAQRVEPPQGATKQSDDVAKVASASPVEATPTSVESGSSQTLRIGRRALELNNLKIDSDSDSD